MKQVIALVLSLIGLGGLVSQQEFVNFRPEISTGLGEVIMSSDVTPTPTPDSEDCPCNKSTGIITHGDGHTSKCPCENGECGCVNSSQEPISSSTEDCADGSCSVQSSSTTTTVRYRTGPLGLFRWRVR